METASHQFTEIIHPVLPEIKPTKAKKKTVKVALPKSK